MKWSDYVKQNSARATFSPDESWTILSDIERGITEKIEAGGTPLKEWDISINYGIKTGCNEAFIIDGATKDRLIEEDSRSAEIIRPILRGRDIKRYKCDFADLYVILAEFGSYAWLPEKYPAVYAHLKQYKEKLEERGQVKYASNGKPRTQGAYLGQHHWLELDNNPRQSYLDDFSKQKIVWAELARTGNAFAYDSSGNMLLNTAYILIFNQEAQRDQEHLEAYVAYLNSSAVLFYLDKLTSRFDENGWRWLKQFVELIPLPDFDIDTIKLLASLSKDISCKRSEKKETEELENKVNSIVGAALQLSDEEIAYLKQNYTVD